MGGGREPIHAKQPRLATPPCGKRRVRYRRRPSSKPRGIAGRSGCPIAMVRARAGAARPLAGLLTHDVRDAIYIYTIAEETQATPGNAGRGHRRSISSTPPHSLPRGYRRSVKRPVSEFESNAANVMKGGALGLGLTRQGHVTLQDVLATSTAGLQERRMAFDDLEGVKRHHCMARGALQRQVCALGLKHVIYRPRM